jgi:hypothetical protein
MRTKGFHTNEVQVKKNPARSFTISAELQYSDSVKKNLLVYANISKLVTPSDFETLPSVVCCLIAQLMIRMAHAIIPNRQCRKSLISKFLPSLGYNSIPQKKSTSTFPVVAQSSEEE